MASTEIVVYLLCSPEWERKKLHCTGNVYSVWGKNKVSLKKRTTEPLSKYQYKLGRRRS